MDISIPQEVNAVLVLKNFNKTIYFIMHQNASPTPQNDTFVLITSSIILFLSASSSSHSNSYRVVGFILVLLIVTTQSGVTIFLQSMSQMLIPLGLHIQKSWIFVILLLPKCTEINVSILSSSSSFTRLGGSLLVGWIGFFF